MGYVAWAYLILPESERDRLEALGSEGWELVGVGGDADEGVLYLKRRALDFRERVTMEQRRRYYESLGIEARGDEGRGGE